MELVWHSKRNNTMSDTFYRNIAIRREWYLNSKTDGTCAEKVTGSQVLEAMADFVAEQMEVGRITGQGFYRTIA